MRLVVKKIVGILQKATLVFAVYVVIAMLFAYFINKDLPKVKIDPIKQNREQIYQVINDSKIQETKTGKIALVVYRLAMCSMIGEACTDKPSDGDVNYPGSFMGTAGNLIAFPYSHPPASGVYWAYTGLQNAGFIPKTYAAEGIGMSVIKPYAEIWKAFRDFSYIILVIILVAIGFMIMFRMKLNPQTVISIENALPRIVVTLILITFSFAIAGFLIDLMYVVMATGIGVVSRGNIFYNAGEFQNKYLSAKMFQLGDGLIPGELTKLGDLGFLFYMGNQLLAIFPAVINGLLRLIFGWVGTYFIYRAARNSPLYEATNMADDLAISGLGFGGSLGKLPGTFLKILGSTAFLIIGGILGSALVPQLLLGLLFLMTVFFLVFRLFSLLFKAYIEIIIMIMFAPIILLINAIPGKNVFSFWFKNLIANLITFPVVILIFCIGFVIGNTITAKDTTFWTPPFIGGIDNNAFAVLIAMGLLFMTPQIVKMIKELLGVKGVPLDFSLMTFFGGAGSVAGGGLGLLTQYGSLALAIPRLRGVVGKYVHFLGEKEATTPLTDQQGRQSIASSQTDIPPGGPKR
jgi:hypothetical protein